MQLNFSFISSHSYSSVWILDNGLTSSLVHSSLISLFFNPTIGWCFLIPPLTFWFFLKFTHSLKTHNNCLIPLTPVVNLFEHLYNAILFDYIIFYIICAKGLTCAQHMHNHWVTHLAQPYLFSSSAFSISWHVYGVRSSMHSFSLMLSYCLVDTASFSYEFFFKVLRLKTDSCCM